MNATMTERFGVAGAMLVKLFGRPETEAERFSSRAARVRDIGVQQAMYGTAFFVAMMLVASLATALTYGVGGWLAVRGTLQPGTVVSLALLLTRLYGPITALSNARINMMSALVSFERVFEVLDLPPAIAEKPGAVTVPKGSSKIEFRDVRFRYPSASRGVARLARGCRRARPHGHRAGPARGQLHGRAGTDGRARRTVRRRQVDHGDAGAAGLRRDRRFGARRRHRRARRDARSRCATPSVWSPRTRTCSTRQSRRTCATRGPDATDEELWTALDRAQIGELVRTLPDGLDTVVGERGYRFSGGEKQRIAIARLLLKAPSIVILDEATAHLDSESEAAVQRALAAALQGRTALVIAHRLSTVRDADQILVLDQGRVVERGTHDELVAARWALLRPLPDAVRGGRLAPDRTGAHRWRAVAFAALAGQRRPARLAVTAAVRVRCGPRRAAP